MEIEYRTFPTTRPLRALACLLFVVLVVPPECLGGNQDDPPQVVGIRVGLANRYKAGLWTQVEVLLRGGSQAENCEVSIIAADSDGVPGCISQSCRLLPGKESAARLITRLGQVHGRLSVELRSGERVRVRKTFQAANTVDNDHFLPAVGPQKLILNLGGAKIGIDALDRGADTIADSPIEAVIEDVHQLPTNWAAYEAVEAAVLTTSRADFCQQLAADPLRLRALQQWLQMGGRLVICAGAQSETVFASGSPLRSFLPGRLDKLVSLRQTAALEMYTGSRAALLQGHGGQMRVPRLVDVQGVIEASEADLPLVVRRAQGFGQVVYLAGDLDAAPLNQWSERPLLLARLLDIATNSGDESHEGAAMMHFGFNDLAGQLRSALDNFDGVQLAPFWLVAGLIIVYIVLLGPGDYFLVRKLIRRMEWTWLTFPLLVLVTSAAAWLLADHFKGRQFRRNQLDLVDIDAASAAVRGTTWLNVFSPRMEAYDFAIAPKLPDGQPAQGPVWTAWLGLPGSALGGMDARSTGGTLWTERFRYADDLHALLGVPIPVWSTKSLTGRWQSTAPSIPAAELAEVDQFLTGSIINTLPFTLEDCLVAYGHSVYEIDSLAPGEVRRLGPGVKRSELRTLLTGRKAVFSEGAKHHQETTPYDKTSTDPWYILRIMMFYDAAGGRRYTGLANSYQHFVDWSSLLKTDRAVLVARGPKRNGEACQGATLLRDGQPMGDSQDEHQTVYRFLFPVRTTRLAMAPNTPASPAFAADRTSATSNPYSAPANQHD